MNVLEISVRSDIGGGPKHLLDLLKEFHGSEINAFCAIPFSGDYAQDIKDLSVDSIEIPFRKFSIFYFIKLLSFIKKNNIEVVHSHGRGAGFYSRLLKLFGLKVIHTFHGIHVDKSFVGKIKFFLDRFLGPFTDKFVCVSVGEKNDAVKYSFAIEKKIIVIPNGVNVEKRTVLPENNTFKIGTLSRLNYQKGIDILINYIDRFVSANDDSFEIQIAGDGELEVELKAMLVNSKALKYVKLIGGTSEPVKFLNTLDAYISFARWEGMPLAVLEGMGVGLPCLLSNVVGNNDLVSHGEDGQLFELSSYESFEKEFKKLLINKDFCLKMGKAASEKVQANFTTKTMAQKTMELYR